MGRKTSPSMGGKICSIARTEATRLPCVCSTALGSPVVPPLKSNAPGFCGVASGNPRGPASETFRQRRCMIATAPRPLQIIHAKAMHQDKNLPAGPRDGGSEIAGIERNRVAVAAQTHGYGERVLSGGKMIAQNPIHGRQHRFPFWRSLRFGAHFDKRSNDGVHTVTDELRDAAHRRVSCAHHASKRVPGNRPVHCLDNRNHSDGGIDT